MSQPEVVTLLTLISVEQDVCWGGRRHNDKIGRSTGEREVHSSIIVC